MTDLLPTDIVPANDTEAAILSRRAVRGFLPMPVPRDDIEHLLNVAARAPSGTNMQPWRVIALAGQPLSDFTTAMVAGLQARAETTG
ncbi:MAG: nitroreductase family protein, partial [Acetobacteraceae bacterium]|nr:nitroreductase family protein [Acetobacteraceae bacterium]